MNRDKSRENNKHLDGNKIEKYKGTKSGNEKTELPRERKGQIKRRMRTNTNTTDTQSKQHSHKTVLPEELVE